MQLNNEKTATPENICPKCTTGGGPCYCPGSIYYEKAREAEEQKVLAVIAREHPEAGELYIRDNHNRGGKQRQVHGKGTAKHGTDRQGVYLCIVGSILWECYAAQVDAD